MSKEKVSKPVKPIDPAFLEEARRRALECLPLSEAQRAEFAILWGRQSNLPKNLRSLATGTLWASGWVLTNLVPGYIDFMSRSVRSINPDYLKILENLKKEIAIDFALGIEHLVQFIDDEQINEDFRTKLKSVLLVIDFGLTGFPIISAILVKQSGYIETSLTLFCDGGLSLVDCVRASEALGDEPRGELSDGDIDFGGELTFPKELLPPDNFNSAEVGFIAPRI